MQLHASKSLGIKIGINGDAYGRYERNEVKPSIEVAAKIADALEVSSNYLTGNTDLLLEKSMVKRMADIQQLPEDEQAHLFALMDALLRDHKTKKAYAQ